MRILSGIRPSGKLHLGNYLGAIKHWIELQNAPDLELAVYMIADYHGITTPFDPKEYHNGVMSMACQYLAAGLDPDKVLLIRQSQVPQHTELGWIFNTITPVSWLDRLPTYKEKLAENPKYHNLGILAYPCLMAADILIYKATAVPVGDDQKAHIDITNEIAKRFNTMFGETFAPVKALASAGHRIRSLQQTGKKMSKSSDEGIALTDPPDTIRDKIKRAVTDSGKEIRFDEKTKPAISNLLTIYHLLSESVGCKAFSVKEIQEKYAGKTYAEFKNDLAEVVVNFLQPLQTKYRQYAAEPVLVEKILADSEAKARTIAGATLTAVKQELGL